MKLTSLNNQLFLLIFIYLGLFTANGQNYKFNNYGVKDGICDPYIYAIEQDKNGFIWLGTGEGLCRFNGFEFTSVNDTLNNAIVSASYKDQYFNIWFGYADGKMSRYNGVHFSHILENNFSSKIIGFDEMAGDLFVASQSHGIARIESGKLEIYSKGISDLFISSLFIKDDLFFIGSMEGLFVMQLENDSLVLKKQISELDYINVQAIVADSASSQLFIGTEDDGLHVLNINTDLSYSISKTGIKELEYENVTSLHIDKEFIWVTTYNGVFKLWKSDKNYLFNHFNESNGLSENYTRVIFEDVEQNLWIGTYGAGIDQKLDESFIFYGEDNIESIVTEGNKIFVGKTGIVEIIDKNTSETLQMIRDGLPNDKVTSLMIDEELIWIGTGSNGVYQYNINKSKVKKFKLTNSSTGNVINFILNDDDVIWFATMNGVYKYFKDNGKIINLTTREGLPHNSIFHLFRDENGVIWVSSKSNGFYTIENDRIIMHEFPFKIGEVEFRSIYVDDNEDIWALTYGIGVFRISKDSLMIYNTNSGLKSNFCYSIMSDGNDKIWIGHRFGISRIDPVNDKIQTFGPEEGFVGDCNMNAVEKDSKEVIYFGTTQGYFSYNSASDKKNVQPPMLNITGIYLNDTPYELNRLTTLPYGIYKLRIEYIGLNFKHPEDVVYQYKFEGKGFDEEFNPPTASTNIVLNNIREGHYKFVLMATNSEGVTTEQPLEFEMRVKLPFWKTWWFYLIAIAVVALIVYNIILFRERKQKQLQEFLEKELAARTKEVVEQKEEIEIKNRDITDSINYAQRIQASILPSIKTLEESFSGSFVFYAPRDIVSGDFYWFDKISNSKFVLVCADSTGHGVPGAFMSMIGTTLIKDICYRSDIKSPAEILSSLDEQLQGTLNQNIEAERSTDGMDIIVCELDLETYKLRVASAMRPMIIYKDGKEIYLKGSRSSIGGNLQIDEKDFEENSIQLSKGDQIYMFSDGYPDQFGGPMGKKFKMVRLKNMLKDIHQKPMDEQFNHIKSTFQLWKNEYNQVDDVLFMGLRI